LSKNDEVLAVYAAKASKKGISENTNSLPKFSKKNLSAAKKTLPGFANCGIKSLNVVQGSSCQKEFTQEEKELIPLLVATEY
jgi:hypothetical protein